jgi:hypothetical protein
LQDRHGRLRGTVEDTLGEIDALLAQHRQPQHLPPQQKP